jgi:hypothetical protein
VLRPEVVRLHPPVAADPPEASDGVALRGTIRDLAFRGAGFTYRIEVAGLAELLKAELAAEGGVPFELGSEVAVTWDAASCGVLPRGEAAH